MDNCGLECSLADTSIVFVGIAGSVRVMVRVRVSSKLVSAKLCNFSTVVVKYYGFVHYLLPGVKH